MRFARLFALIVVATVVAAIAYVATPYVRAASLFVRVGNVGGRLEASRRRRRAIGNGAAAAQNPRAARRSGGAVVSAGGTRTPIGPARSRRAFDGHCRAASHSACPGPGGQRRRGDDDGASRSDGIPDHGSIGRRDRGRGGVDGGAAGTGTRRTNRDDWNQFRRRTIDCRRGSPVHSRQGRLRRLVRWPRRPRARAPLPGDRRSRAGARGGNYSTARLRCGGHPVRRRRSRGAAGAGEGAARRHRHVPPGVAIDAGRHGPGERHVRRKRATWSRDCPSRPRPI